MKMISMLLKTVKLQLVIELETVLWAQAAIHSVG